MNTSTNPSQEPTAFTPKAHSFAGLSYVPVPLGAIRIGQTAPARDGTTVVEKFDEFRVTLPRRDNSGNWMPDPLDAALRAGSGHDTKLKAIPVRVLTDRPDLACSSRFEAYDAVNNRMVCSGNGNGTAKRVDAATGDLNSVACVGCGTCDFGNTPAVQCRFLGRLSLQIKGQESVLGQYIVRTSSYNTMKTVEAKLLSYAALFGGLRGLPLLLVHREVQSQYSNWEDFPVIDLELDGGLQAGVKGRETALSESHGLNYDALAAQMALSVEQGFAPTMFDDCADLNEFVRVRAVASPVAAAAPMQPIVEASVMPATEAQAPAVHAAGNRAKVASAIPSLPMGALRMDDFVLPSAAPQGTGLHAFTGGKSRQPAPVSASAPAPTTYGLTPGANLLFLAASDLPDWAVDHVHQ